MQKEVPDRRRRRLINWFLGGSLSGLVASICYPLARYLSPPSVPEAATEQVDAGTTNDPSLLQKGFKIVRFGIEPVILIRIDEQDFRAFSATCTHLDCVVEYQSSEKRIFCNCHNGQYDLTGRNVAGPPPKPLRPYTVNLVAAGPGQPESIVISKG